MQKAEYPFLADWFSISLRWLILLGITVSLVVAGSMNWPVTIIILIGTIWNIILSTLAIFNIRLGFHRYINTFLDLIFTTLLFFFSGGLLGPLVWVGLMAIFSSAIYFGWKGSLLVALALTIFDAGGSVFGWGGSAQPVLFNLFIFSGFNLVAGAVFGILSTQLYRAVRSNFQGIVKGRKENDSRLQRSERQRMQTFFSMTEVLSATLDYQVVLEKSLDLCLSTLQTNPDENKKLVGAILLFSDHDLQVNTSRGLPVADQYRSFPAEAGVLQAVVDRAEPQQISKPQQDPELQQMLALQNCTSVLLLPLRRGLSAYGVMLFAHQDPAFFNTDRCELLEMISQQAVIAIQNARLFQDLETEKQRIISTQEEERKELARSLHDGPTQSVSGIAMRAEYIQKLLERQTDSAKIDEELNALKELARRTVQEIRHMLFILRPLVLESEGLIHALEVLAGKMKDLYQQNVVVDVNAEVVEKLDTKKQTVIFQITEEAVNNARKHAEAAEIRIKLNYITRDKAIVLLEINDNGVGFNVKSVTSSYDRRGSLGMVNLRERSELINGLLHIDSAPGKGTRVQVAIPLTPEATDRLQHGKTQPNP